MNHRTIDRSTPVQAVTRAVISVSLLLLLPNCATEDDPPPESTPNQEVADDVVDADTDADHEVDERWPGLRVVVEDGDNSLCCCATNEPNCHGFQLGGSGSCSTALRTDGSCGLVLADAAPVGWTLQEDEYGCPLWVLTGRGEDCGPEGPWDVGQPDALDAGDVGSEDTSDVGHDSVQDDATDATEPDGSDAPDGSDEPDGSDAPDGSDEPDGSAG